MTSWSRVKIKGKKVIVKLGGYSGKKESTSPIEDIMTANRAWIPKDVARKLKLKVGSTVTVTVAGKKVRGKVTRWSRGSKQIVFSKPLNLTRKQARRIHVDVD